MGFTFFVCTYFRDNRRFDRRGDDRYGNGNAGNTGYSEDPRRRREVDDSRIRRPENDRRRNEIEDPRRDEFRRQPNEGQNRRRENDDTRRWNDNDDPRRRNERLEESTSSGDPVEDARRLKENEARRRAEPESRRGNEDRWYSRHDDFNGGGSGRGGPSNRAAGSGRFGNYREADEPEWMSATLDQVVYLHLYLHFIKKVMLTTNHLKKFYLFPRVRS